jgi:ABC-type sugar transport system ATPase subunit
MIRVEALQARAGRFVLGPLDLHVRTGSSFALLGPTGAGKTVFLESILGLHRPLGGRVVLNGEEITDLPPERRGIAYLPQDVALFPHLSVRDNILFGPSVRKLSPSRWRPVYDSLVERLQLEPLLDRRDPRLLSGGERQRVALARALVVKPQVLFLDEPFSALDALARRSLQMSILDLQRDTGLTFFHVTHDQEEAFIMADRMAVMLGGRIEQEGEPEAFHARPRNLAVARFLLMQNLFEAEASAEEGRLTVKEAGLELWAGAFGGPWRPGDCHVGIRPESLVIVRPDRPLAPWMDRNVLEGQVERVLNLGNRRNLRAAVGTGGGLHLEVALSQHAYHDMKLAEGAPVTLNVKPEHVWVHFGE